MRILNIGSINIDKSYDVEKFITAGKTSKALAYRQSFGGKGLNQSIALCRAGAEVWHAGAIGEDGEDIARLLQQEGIHSEYLQRVAGPTGHAIIQIDPSGQNCILIDGGANDSIGHHQVDEALRHFQAGDALVLQNEIPCLSYAIRQGRARGMRVFLNPSPIERESDIEAISEADFLILNEVEAQILTGESDSARMLDALVDKYGQTAIVLTLGKDGVLYADARERASHGCYDVPVVDTTAAGDTFAGYFIAAVCAGKSVEAALREASIASNICVSRPGAAAAIPYRREVDAFAQAAERQ